MSTIDTLGQLFEGLEETKTFIEEILGPVEAIVGSESTQEILQYELKTPEGQKLYNDVKNLVMNPLGAIEQAFADTVETAAPKVSAENAQKLSEYQNRVHQEVEQFQTASPSSYVAAAPGASSGTSGASGKTSSAGSNSASSSAYSSQTSSSGAGYSSGSGRSESSSSTVSPSAVSSSVTSTQATSSDTDCSMTSYVRNAKQPLTSNNLTTTDNMVVSMLSFLSRTEFQDPSKKNSGVSIGEYCKQLLASDNQYSAQERQFLQELTTSTRYKNLTVDSVSLYHNGQIDTNVICVNLGDNKAIFGIEGTNGTVQDWINDGRFSSPDPTDEEMYITNLIDDLTRKNGYDGIYLAGHSQGGREAVTAAAFCSSETKSKILGVMNLDGPGYSDAFREKYADQLALIEGKVTNIYPSGSYVGQIYTGIGESFYTESKGDTFYAYLHSTFNWITDENGNVVAPDQTTSKYIVGKMINIAVDYIGSKLSPEQTEQLLSIVFRTAYSSEDPTQIDFKEILNHLDELSWGDWEIVLESLAAVVLPIMSKYYETLSNIAGFLEPFCIFLGEYSELAKTILTIIKYGAKVMKFLCDAAVTILQWIAKIRAERLKKERENYISNNPELKFISAALLSAAEHLNAANNWIIQADSDCDRLRRGFRESEEDEEGNIINWVFKKFSTLASVLRYFGLAAIDIGWLGSQPHLLKGVRCSKTISAEGVKILASIPYAVQDAEFFANPSTLSQLASSASDQVKNAIKLFDEADEAIQKLGNAWKGEDYNDLRSKTKANFAELKENMNTVDKAVSLLDAAAKIYASFQDRCIQEFQAAKR